MPKVATKPKNQKVTKVVEKIDVAKISAELQALQRKRSIVMKSRNMQANRLQAVVAGTLGYYAAMPEKERTAKFKEATELIKRVGADESVKHPLADIIRITLIGINAFNTEKKRLEKEMRRYALSLPVAGWVKEPDQKGFGILNLAILVGETGDLANYANPAKVWRRLGCAPWTFNEKTLMGATWRSGKEGKLPAEEWEKFGYSPRRRCISYLIGEGLMKQNFINETASAVEEEEEETDKEGSGTPGPYRKIYDERKADIRVKHPDYPDQRCHRHGMLVATKRLLKLLWVRWNNKPAVDERWGK